MPRYYISMSAGEVERPLCHRSGLSVATIYFHPCVYIPAVKMSAEVFLPHKEEQWKRISPANNLDYICHSLLTVTDSFHCSDEVGDSLLACKVGHELYCFPLKCLSHVATPTTWLLMKEITGDAKGEKCSQNHNEMNDFSFPRFRNGGRAKHNAKKVIGSKNRLPFWGTIWAGSLWYCSLGQSHYPFPRIFIAVDCYLFANPLNDNPLSLFDIKYYGYSLCQQKNARQIPFSMNFDSQFKLLM